MSSIKNEHDENGSLPFNSCIHQEYRNNHLSDTIVAIQVTDFDRH